MRPRQIAVLIFVGIQQVSRAQRPESDGFGVNAGEKLSGDLRVPKKKSRTIRPGFLKVPHESRTGS